jgi:methylated-DNA-[protein]-cysteine S-methyltransferase
MPATHTVIDSPLGPLTLVGEEGALTGLYFPGHWTRPDRGAFGRRTDEGFDAARGQLDEYFAGRRAAFDLETRVSGEPFQLRVWELLHGIPYGETTTYGELARELGDPAMARAVGAAVGANPLSIVCPCHRVVGKDGRLTGYAGGLERKRLLLELEAPPAAAAPAELTFFEAR